ncbi:hypothetical protein RJT34_11808 [Clitoria ternatea]|uniref:Uncharacterized protein n=1 Tax=Clitoria ternatea TaxID=43366 RepID=A0AAN9JKM4_CLITE
MRKDRSRVLSSRRLYLILVPVKQEDPKENPEEAPIEIMEGIADGTYAYGETEDITEISVAAQDLLALASKAYHLRGLRQQRSILPGQSLGSSSYGEE